ncbi:MAG: sigma-54 dependent transcriptional regulator [Aestuariivirga sp.]
MDRNSTVLVIGGRTAAWRSLVEILSERFGYRVLAGKSAPDGAKMVADAHVDLAIAEEAGNINGCNFLTELRVSHPEIARVLVLGEGTNTSNGALSHAAVYQFLRHPLDPEQASLVVKRGLEARELARRHRLLSREFKLAEDSSILTLGQAHGLGPRSQRFEKLVYVSEKMAELCDLARTAAKTELPILIQGETGTGKELLARAIHYNSKRRASPLLVQNCGGLPDELLQSELFGHKRGAYTGAISDRLGLFRAADGGTVFLDEISEVSKAFQVSLLRFLQDGEIKPLGADRTISSNVRIIAASNKPLAKLVAAGEFRRDLYFRLKGFEFEVPPLRDRPEDVAALAEFFAAKHSEATGRKLLGISANVLEKLSCHDFPGNVRELENEIRRLVVLTNDAEYVTTRHMTPAIRDAAPRRQALPGHFSIEGSTLKAHVESLERQLVSETLARHRWNQSRAAGELGLSRVGLANKIKRYGLDQVQS